MFSENLLTSLTCQNLGYLIRDLSITCRPTRCIEIDIGCAHRVFTTSILMIA